MQAVSVTPVVGLPQVNGWSQVIDHTYRGTHLVATLAISGENASSVGREIIAMILEQEPAHAQHLYEFLTYLVQYAQHKGCELSLILGLFVHSRCIVSSCRGTVWLKRQAKVGAIVEADEEVALLEGSAKEDDTFIFATSQARQFLPTIELQFGQGYDVDGVITAIVPAVHSLENSSLNALAFVTITQRVEGQLEEQNISRSSVQPTQSYIPVHTENRVSAAESMTSKFSEEDEAISDPTTSQSDTQLSSHTREEQNPGISLEKVWEFFVNIPKLFSAKTYVGTHLSRKYLLWIAGLVAVILIGVGIGIYFILHLKTEQAFAAELLLPFSQRIDQAIVTAEQDPLTARTELEGVVADLVRLQAEYKQTRRTQILTKLEETLIRAREVQQDISGKQEFSDLPIFYDLRLASSDFLTTVATVQGQTGVFIDAQKKSAIILDLSSKQVFSINLQELEPIVAVSALEESSIALIANGVYSVALTQDSKPAVIKEQGDSNRAADFINSFGSYVYVFNPEKRNIYRYSKPDNSDTYSDPIGWLQDPLGVSFDSVKSFMIDGDIWLSTDSGEILKFSAGKATNFAVTGMAEPFSTPTFLFTQESINDLYVLEPEKKRVVVVNKEGQFVREVRSDSLASATGLFVHEALGKAFAVSGSIVYEVAL